MPFISCEYPDKLTHLLLFTLRYLDMLHHEYVDLLRAMKARAFRPRMNLHTYGSFAYMMAMLLVRSLERSERIMAAMKCRGFRGQFNTFRDFAFQGRDLLFSLASLLLFVALGLSGTRWQRCMVTTVGKQLVHLSDLKFHYPHERLVLDSVELSLRQGERVGLVGPIGSGKTTLLHLIVGLLKPTEGVVRVFDMPRVAERDFWEVRERVGLLFQDPDDQLFCPTVAEDVAFGPLNQGKSREETQRLVSETLTMLGLDGFEKRVTHHLSGGEKRLVSVASVLAMQPDVLLLDEPIEGLDPQTAERFTDVLLALPQTMLVVSHNKVFLDRVITRRVQLNDGRICEN